MPDKKKIKININLFDFFLKKLKEFIIEYKKIVWPSFKMLYNMTLSVIFLCLIFGLIIFVLDLFFGFCSIEFVKFFTNKIK
ncbi:MAG: preprotein translocase subunit SecE [Clostridiales bacterium]|jgi:preprotein translocase SecE subunit|nr:preprotein translocase subunit SecE [Clostridiales bacterium]